MNGGGRRLAGTEKRPILIRQGMCVEIDAPVSSFLFFALTCPKSRDLIPFHFLSSFLFPFCRPRAFSLLLSSPHCSINSEFDSLSVSPTYLGRKTSTHPSFPPRGLRVGIRSTHTHTLSHNSFFVKLPSPPLVICTNSCLPFAAVGTFVLFSNGAVCKNKSGV